MTISDILQLISDAAPLVAMIACAGLIAAAAAGSTKSPANLLASAVLAAMLLAYYHREAPLLLRGAGAGHLPAGLIDSLAAGLQYWARLAVSVAPKYNGYQAFGITLLETDPSLKYTATVYPVALVFLGFLARWLVVRHAKSALAQTATRRYWLMATAAVVTVLVLQQMTRIGWISVFAIIASAALIHRIVRSKFMADVIGVLRSFLKLVRVGLRIAYKYLMLIAVRGAKFARRIRGHGKRLYAGFVVSPAARLNSSLLAKLQAAEGKVSKALEEERGALTRMKRGA